MIFYFYFFFLISLGGFILGSPFLNRYFRVVLFEDISRISLFANSLYLFTLVFLSRVGFSGMCSVAVFMGSLLKRDSKPAVGVGLVASYSTSPSVFLPNSLEPFSFPFFSSKLHISVLLSGLFRRSTLV